MAFLPRSARWTRCWQERAWREQKVMHMLLVESASGSMQNVCTRVWMHRQIKSFSVSLSPPTAPTNRIEKSTQQFFRSLHARSLVSTFTQKDIIARRKEDFQFICISPTIPLKKYLRGHKNMTKLDRPWKPDNKKRGEPHLVTSDTSSSVLHFIYCSSNHGKSSLLVHSTNETAGACWLIMPQMILIVDVPRVSRYPTNTELPRKVSSSSGFKRMEKNRWLKIRQEQDRSFAMRRLWDWWSRASDTRYVKLRENCTTLPLSMYKEKELEIFRIRFVSCSTCQAQNVWKHLSTDSLYVCKKFAAWYHVLDHWHVQHYWMCLRVQVLRRRWLVKIGVALSSRRGLKDWGATDESTTSVQKNKFDFLNLKATGTPCSHGV